MNSLAWWENHGETPLSMFLMSLEREQRRRTHPQNGYTFQEALQIQRQEKALSFLCFFMCKLVLWLKVPSSAGIILEHLWIVSTIYLFSCLLACLLICLSLAVMCLIHWNFLMSNCNLLLKASSTNSFEMYMGHVFLFKRMIMIINGTWKLMKAV